MEFKFKGTKKFPKYYGGDNYSIDLIFDNDAVISIDRRSRYNDDLVMSRKEMEANALLISKAPALLDFVNRISGEMLRNDFVLDEMWYDQAKELIKQATEL